MSMELESQKLTVIRPKWIWAISGWYFLSLAWSLLSFSLVYTNSIPLTVAQRSYFDNLGLVDYAASAVCGVLTLIGALQLFRLRKNAEIFWAASLGLNCVFTLSHLWNSSEFAQAAGRSGLLGIMLGLMALGLVYLYAQSLRKQGVLM